MYFAIVNRWLHQKLCSRLHQMHFLAPESENRPLKNIEFLNIYLRNVDLVLYFTYQTRCRFCCIQLANRESGQTIRGIPIKLRFFNFATFQKHCKVCQFHFGCSCIFVFLVIFIKKHLFAIAEYDSKRMCLFTIVKYECKRNFFQNMRFRIVPRPLLQNGSLAVSTWSFTYVFYNSK